LLLPPLLCFSSSLCSYFYFFFYDSATTEIYTLSLHDALPIFVMGYLLAVIIRVVQGSATVAMVTSAGMMYPIISVMDLSDPMKTDRKSTRLNSSHVKISYAVFCLKKKKK